MVGISLLNFITLLVIFYHIINVMSVIILYIISHVFLINYYLALIIGYFMYLLVC